MNNLPTRALTSASNLHQRELCPGSAFAEQGRPNTDNDDSKEGAMLHALDADPKADRSHLTGEQREVLTAAAEADEHIFAAIATRMEISQDEFFIEGREDERWMRRGFKSLFPGHPDRWRYYTDRKVLVVIDKKFGRNEVTPAEVNRQLLAYALMTSEDYEADHIFVAINQPRLPAMKRITIGEYSRETLEASKAIVYSIWGGSHNPDGSAREDAPRIAGESQCRYCKAKLDCDAYAAKFTFLEAPSHDGKDVFVGKLLSLTDDQLDRIYLACNFAGKIKDDVKDEILRRMESGGMTNFSAKPSGMNTNITDSIAARRILTGAGLPDAQITRLETMTTITKVAAEVMGLSEAKAKKEVEGLLASVSEKEPKAPTLKRNGALQALPQ